MTPLHFEELLNLDGKSVVLVPSDASARQLRERIAVARGEHDQAFLETMSVVPVAQWLAELWDESLPSRQVLRPIQLLAIAQKIIESSEFFPANCLNSLAIVRQFVDAFQIHAAYCLGSNREDYLFSAEYQAFFHWRSAMQEAMDELDAMSAEQLPAALSAALPEGLLQLPARLVLSPLLHLTPATHAFVEQCRAQGVQCFQLDDTLPDAVPSLYGATQLEQECDAIANWLAGQLSQQPEANLAVLVADMNNYRAPLERALQRRVFPQSLYVEGEAQEAPWAFEGSESLYAYPLIRAAWDVISLRQGALPLEQLSRVLRSRFVADWPAMRQPRAQYDRFCRDRLAVQCQLGDMLALAPYFGEDAGVDVLQALHSHISAQPSRQLPSAWVRSFDQMLLAAGWPNADSDDPVVADCRRGFSQAMDVFRALDRQLGEVAHSDALHWLQHILTTKRFAVSRRSPARIRVLQYEEALGLHFDGAWIAGLDDAALPRRAEPSPFLPLHLQRQAQVDGCEPGLCLQRDRALLAEILRSAPVLMCSYAGEDPSGTPRAPCSLLPAMAAAEMADGELPVRCQGQLTHPQSDAVRPVAPEQRARLRGGSGLFKEYAQSPFLAFLKYRLRLKEFPRPAEGLDHRLQGILVHDSLEKVWQRLGGKAALDALDFAGIERLVAQCVDEALQGSEINPQRFGESLMQLEKTRVVALISHWLEYKEKARLQDFEVVALETAMDTQLMGIPLKLRIDRIDRIGDKRLVIDYKTGSIDGKALNSDSLTEPQLPIYALAASEDSPVDGVMLAQLRSPDDLKVHMRSNWANSVIAKKAHGNDVDSPEKWQAELRAWEGALQSMAEGILAGNIAHDYSTQLDRSFSAYLLPLLRDSATSEDE